MIHKLAVYDCIVFIYVYDFSLQSFCPITNSLSLSLIIYIHAYIFQSVPLWSLMETTIK
uniref:Uncharacterized protein n=1 Tax=Octopus bimaculoides TaxID=37653 RepID=A0A0L8FX84_OCTBM